MWSYWPHRFTLIAFVTAVPMLPVNIVVGHHGIDWIVRNDSLFQP